MTAKRRIITCIGAGRMGRGIAHAVAYGGHAVRLLDAKQRTPESYETFKQETIAEVSSTLAMLAGLGAFDAAAIPQILGRVSVHSMDEAGLALRGASIVFEGVPEVLEVKAEAFKLFDKHADETAIFASTTSTILSTDLAQFTQSPQRFLNAHWLNPAFMVPLVEISPTGRTNENVVLELNEFLESIGKMPVVCKAAPGYIVPRIQALALNEAARLVEEGVASPEDVDKAIKYGFGLRFAVLGMLEFIDWGGGDILYYASQYMSDATNSDRFKAPEIVNENMKNGHVGLRSGKGFFDYNTIDVDAYKQQRLGAFLKMLQHNQLVRPPVLD